MNYDLLIIGGGPVGASLACALRGRGLKIGVVEASPLPAPVASGSPAVADERTIALAYGSRRIFEAIGVWAAIDARGLTPIEHIHVSDRGRFGFARLHAADAGLPALGYVVEVGALGAALRAGLAGAADVEWLCPAIMERVALETDVARVTVRHAGAERTLSAALVVAADGAHSAVRQALGIAAESREYPQSAIVATVRTGVPHRNTAYERFTATGPLALLPMAGKRMTVVWSALRAEVDAILGWDDGEFLARLQERFGDRLGAFTEPGRRRAYPLARMHVAEPVRARLALIGNAAHTVHPVAGQGFNLGLRDVAALAETLVAARAAGHDLGAPQALRGYAEGRRRDTALTGAFTDGLIRVFANDHPALAAARDLALLGVDLLPGAKRGLIRLTSGLAGRLPRLARGLPL